MITNRFICALGCATLALSMAAQEAKYVFYFIGDGMGIGHVNATQYYNRIVKGVEEPLLMQQFPYMATLTTYSASDPVTDSAAAGTALATGFKTINGMVGMAPDSITPFKSIASRLKECGWGIGLVTSVPADDATPSSFYAHQANRRSYLDINRQAAHSGFDFIGGSNLRGTAATDGHNLDLFDKAGYTLITSTAAPIPADVQKVLLQSPQGLDEIGYTIDSIPGTFKLADMTSMALDFLSHKSPEKFFLMVEGGNIDHAAHANDAGTVIKEILAFQDAIEVAYDFYLAHPSETLIIVTADHDTGGMVLNGNLNLDIIDYQRISKDLMADICRDMVKRNEVPEWDEMKEFLTAKLGLWKNVKISDDQEKAIKAAYDKTFVMRNSTDEKGLYNSFNEFVVEVFKVQNHLIGASYTSYDHTANPVPLYAIGVGAERLSGPKDNTHIPGIILSCTECSAGK